MGNILGGVLFLLAFMAAWLHRPVAAVLAVSLALVVRLVWSSARSRPVFGVSALGIAWTHPVRGNGALSWKQIGALIVREARAGRELAVYLVPSPQSPGTENLSPFVLSTGDLGVGRTEGENRLREFVSSVLPYLPAEVSLDRATRARLSAWDIRFGVE